MASSVIGALRATLGLDSAAFEDGLGLAQKKLNRFGKDFQKMGQRWGDLGQQLSLAITAPIAAIGVASVRGAEAQAQAMAQVEAALASMGPVAGRTADQLLKASDALELKSLYDGDEILKKVTANLLTFGNVSGTAFDRAQQAAIDLSTRMGTDLQSSALLVGKALNDPIKGMTALGRAGIQFSADQKSAINAMVETGNVAGAQAIILGELEKQFGGAAAAAANTSPWRKAQVAFGQAGDAIGAALLPFITKLADVVGNLALGFTQLSPTMQNVVIVVGAIAAAIGPVLIALGAMASGIGAIIPLLGTAGLGAAAGGGAVALGALVAAAAPFVAAAAGLVAAGVAIYNHWDNIAPVLDSVGAALEKALGPSIQSIISSLSTILNELWNGPLGTGIAAAGQAIATFGAEAGRVLGPVLLEVLRALGAAVAQVFRVVADSVSTVSNLLTGNWSAAWNSYVSMIRNLIGPLPAFVIDQMAKMVTGVGEWIGNKLAAIWDDAAKKIQWVQDKFFGLADAVVFNSYIPDMVDQIGIHMARLQGEMVDPAAEALGQVDSAFQTTAQTVAGAFQSIAGSVQGFVRSIKSGDIVGIVDGLLGVVGQVAGAIGAVRGTPAPSIPAPGRAAGGPVTAGRPYLVGERGPELMVPNTSGSVIPNGRLRGQDRMSVEVVKGELFDVIVTRMASQVANEQIGRAAPGIAAQGAAGALTRLQRLQGRRLS